MKKRVINKDTRGVNMDKNKQKEPVTPPKKMAHIGIAVHSLEEALSFYQKELGLPLEGIETVESEGVRVAFLSLGETRIELLESITSTGPIAKFIEKRGAGIHHLAFDVDDIKERLKRLKEHGIQLIHEQPKEGAHGAQIAFLHPKSTGGALLELCQYKSHTKQGGILK